LGLASSPLSARPSRSATRASGWKRIAGDDDLRRESALWEILRVQRDDEIGTAVLGAFPEGRVSWVGLGLDRSCRFDQFSFFPQQVDDRSDERRANMETPEHGLVLVRQITEWDQNPHRWLVPPNARFEANDIWRPGLKPR